MAYIFELLMEVKMMRNKNKTTYENLLLSIVFNEKSLLQFIKTMKRFLNSQVKENIKYYGKLSMIHWQFLNYSVFIFKVPIRRNSRNAY